MLITNVFSAFCVTLAADVTGSAGSIQTVAKLQLQINSQHNAAVAETQTCNDVV